MTDHQQAALEAAANSLRQIEPNLYQNPYNPQRYYGGLAQDAIAAAEPHLRAKWAEELERAMFKVESVHHFGFGYHGFKCLCGFESLRNRSRTEHITQAVRNLLEGAGE